METYTRNADRRAHPASRSSSIGHSFTAFIRPDVTLQFLVSSNDHSMDQLHVHTGGKGPRRRGPREGQVRRHDGLLMPVASCVASLPWSYPGVGRRVGRARGTQVWVCLCVVRESDGGAGASPCRSRHV